MSVTVTDRRAPALAAQPSNARLYAALARFQAELPTLVAEQTATVTGETKTGQKTSYKYNYANLGDFSPLVLRLLGKHELAWTTKPTMVNGQFMLAYKLTHSSGEEDGGFYPLPDPSRVDAQKLGGAITYARRYALCAMVGIAPGKDDDDAQGSRNRPAASAPETPEEREVKDSFRQVTDLITSLRLPAAQVVTAYYRRFQVDIRSETNAENLRAFHAELRHDPDAALALDPATGAPQRETAEQDGNSGRSLRGVS